MTEKEISQLLMRSSQLRTRSARRAQVQSILVIAGLTAISWSLIALLWRAHV